MTYLYLRLPLQLLSLTDIPAGFSFVGGDFQCSPLETS